MIFRKHCNFNCIKGAKIFVESYLSESENVPLREIEIYCFNGTPKIAVIVRYGEKREISVFNEKLKNIDLLFHPDGKNEVVNKKADELINQTFVFISSKENTKLSMKEILVLSKQLAKDFYFVRVDWIICNNKLYFNELTFTPYSGMMRFDENWNEKLGTFLELKEKRA